MPLMSSEAIATHLKKGREQKVFSDGAVAVFEQGNWNFVDPFGCDDTFFDLSSLSKVLATTYVLNSFFREKKLSPETPLAELIALVGEGLGVEFPEKWEERLQGATVDDVLYHRAPLKWRVELYKDVDPLEPLPPRDEIKKRYVERLVSTAIDDRPKGEVVYSDVGLGLLGLFVEHQERKRFREVFRETVPESVRREVTFLPFAGAFSTGFCSWRQVELKGTINDNDAYLFGGDCGHVGLFGTLKGVTLMLEPWCVGYHKDTELLTQEEVHFFCKGAKATNEKGYAFRRIWDSPSENGFLNKVGWSTEGYGHWGFTGTGLWYDPNEKRGIVILTNRVQASGWDLVPFREWREELFQG